MASPRFRRAVAAQDVKKKQKEEKKKMKGLWVRPVAKVPPLYVHNAKALSPGEALGAFVVGSESVHTAPWIMLVAEYLTKAGIRAQKTVTWQEFYRRMRWGRGRAYEARRMKKGLTLQVAAQMAICCEAPLEEFLVRLLTLEGLPEVNKGHFKLTTLVKEVDINARTRRKPDSNLRYSSTYRG